MTRYEYLVDSVLARAPVLTFRERATAGMKRLGDEGWRLVSAVCAEKSDLGPSVYFFYCREVQPEQQ